MFVIIFEFSFVSSIIIKKCFIFVETREESVQTEVNDFKNDLCVNCIKKSNPVIEDSKKIKCDNMLAIPGFDDSLLDLQIETISRNTIAVKHCVTNIIVQFDVAIPSEKNRHLTQSVSCVPVSDTESHTKIFKSKTTIVNAILPAELCSILPKTMQTIIGSKLLLPKMIDIAEPHSSPIVELTKFESGNLMKHLIPVHIPCSPELRHLGQGNFAKYNKPTTTIKTFSNITSKLIVRPFSFEEFYSQKVTEFGRNLLNNCYISQIAALRVVETNHSRNQEPEIENKLFQPKVNCMVLQSYSLDNKRITRAFKFNFIDFIVAIIKNPVFSVQISMSRKKSLSGLNSVKSIQITMGLEVEENNRSCHNSNEIIGVYNNFQNNIAQPKISNSYLKKQKAITNAKYRSSSHLNKFENCKSGFEYSVNHIRNMKKSYVKLYRKCKSMSSISNERSCIALSKIINFEDFFLALGSARSLASIFDGNTERKILTSIKEVLELFIPKFVSADERSPTLFGLGRLGLFSLNKMLKLV